MKHLKSKRGVSPVIGVLLMVAITVILATVIASFIFGMCTKVKSAPQVQLYLEDASDMINGGNDDLFNVTHYGGDDLKLSEIRLQVMNTITVCTLTWGGTSFSGYNNLVAEGIDIQDGILSVRESFTVRETADVFNTQDTLTFRVQERIQSRFSTY